ncbi:hypothetical protein FHS55_000198 [Angulomicrobium tetraedrale]|uniref:Uncharacterized protein n=1 Tax=Ancylobacter tetraedralis TaxID=217068 RepID=A0A839Z1S3_9HYPH|nr:hypothetical protein [Ancylobacter tetraedralis]MBB3769612.1 hypothetical protein [Ancylobacter tetraedralis]
MPRLVRFLLRHALIGFGLAVFFVGALLLLDVARLGTLIGRSPFGWLATLVLVVSVGITFASVQMGFAVMLLPRDDDAPQGRGGTRAPSGSALRLVRLPARAATGRNRAR